MQPEYNKMSSTTQKHKSFVSEPMGRKSLQDIAGIGNAYGGRLAERGFTNASQLYGQYLVLNRNEQQFRNWLTREGGVNQRHAGNAYACLNEYHHNFS